MAHIEKYTRAQVGGLTRHFERAKNGEGEYIHFGNQEIDLSKTDLNYNLAPEQNQLEFIKNRTNEVKCLNRDDVNVMCSWVVTAPKTLEDNKELTEKFFKDTYGFLKAEHGEKNIISAHVHMDETAPHMHFAFVPVVMSMDKKKGIEIEKVRAKDVVTRDYLKTFHTRFNQHMEQSFGYDIGVLNGATANGNLSITELKLKNAQEKLSALEQQAEKKQGNIEVLSRQEKALQSKIGALDKELKGKVLTRKGFENIKPEKTITGGLKNITLDEFESIQKTLDTYFSRAEKLNHRVKELESENKILKTKIPTMEDKKQSAILVRDFNMLQRESQNLKKELGELKEFISELPQEVQDLINTKNEKDLNQNRGRDIEPSL